MTTTQGPRITGKQKQVLDHLKAGRTVEEIARRMNITSSGVYGHMRNMRRAGVTLPGEAMEPEPAATPAAPEPTPLVEAVERAAGRLGATEPTSEPNGRVDPAEALATAVKLDDLRRNEVEGEIAALNGRIEGLREELDALTSRREKYTAALDALK